MENKILVEISARHVHLSKKTLEVLFGEGYELTPKKYLSQPGQFASEERITVVGPKKTFESVAILGPTRSLDQVELSLTDARAIGIDAPIRESGDVAGTPDCKLIGPRGEVEIKEGVIVAKRHIHAPPEDAEKHGLHDRQVVSIKVVNDSRSMVFGDVVVRVSKIAGFVAHFDTDEANAGALLCGMYGEIIP